MATELISGYLSKAFSSVDTLVDEAREALKGVEFDTIIGTGLSGGLVVPTLARALGKHFAIARKPQAESHGSYQVEGTIGDLWIFVDDFIDSGQTLKRVVKTVENASKSEWHLFSTQYVGTYQYSKGTYSKFGEESSFGRFVFSGELDPNW